MIKLKKLEDRHPGKLTIHVTPDVNEALIAYANLYRETYGAHAEISDLVPAMIRSYLDSDRVFTRAYRKVES